MLLKKIKERTDIQNSSKKLNQSNINIFKKTFSNLNIKIKSKKNNSFLFTNRLSMANRLPKREASTLLNNKFLRSTLNKNKISIKKIFNKCLKKKLLTDKTAREMENKFYIRYKEGVNDLSNSFNMFNTVIKSHEKIVKKIFSDYKNIQNYNKKLLNYSLHNYNRNLEFLENLDKVKELQVIRSSKKFEKMRNSNYINSLFPRGKTPSDSRHSSLFSSPKNKLPSKKKEMSKYKKLEQEVHNALLQKRYFTYKKLKKNSQKFCEDVRDLDRECESYEPIDDETSKINLKKNNFFNIGNLDRIIKLASIKNEKYYKEDFENNRPFFKKCNEASNFLCDKAIAGYCPSFLKKGKFLPNTMRKYNNLQGKFFGLPV